MPPSIHHSRLSVVISQRKFLLFEEIQESYSAGNLIDSYSYFFFTDKSEW